MTVVATLVGGSVTLVLSLLLPVVVRPLLVRLGVVDVPTDRSSHERPVLRGLGLAVLIAMVAGGCVATSLLWASDRGPLDGAAYLALIVLASLASGLLGLAEDLTGISVPVRSVILLVIAAASAVILLLMVGSASGEALRWLPGFHVGHWPVWMQILLGVYAVLFISSYINVTNFMDGLNGISGLHGVIAGLTFAVAGWFMGFDWLLAAGLLLAAGFAGFLPWNLSKPGAFLGDVGSYLLGGGVAVTSFAALVTGVPILATIGPMVIYFGDVGVTLVKRVRAGHQWDEPHKEHVYQRLQQSGRSHIWASGVTAAFSAAASLLGLASMFFPPMWWLVFLAAGLAVLVVYVTLPRWVRPRAGFPNID